MNHTCHRCGRSFARREHLVRHDRSHTKEQPYRCNECPKAFTRRDLLTRHNRLSHATEPAPSLSLATTSTAVEESISTTAPVWDQFVAPVSSPSLTNGFGAFEDFSTFLDGWTLPTHPYSPSHQPLPFFFDSPAPASTRVPEAETWREVSVPTSSIQSVRTGGISRFGSRLPSLEPDPLPINGQDSSSDTDALSLSPTCMDKLKSQINSYENVLGEYTIPTRYALNRYFQGYFRGFHQHYPILHPPTFSVHIVPIELLLAVACLGAQYCLEREAGFKLFYVAKAIAIERLRERGSRAAHSETAADTTLTSLHTFVLLTAVSMWSEKSPPFHEALSFRSTLESLIRQLQSESNTPTMADNDDWHDWITGESIQRAVIITFCFSNLQTMVFDVPPMMLIQDVSTRLPCSEKEWAARTQEEWRKRRTRTQHTPKIQTVFYDLFKPDDTSHGIGSSALGCHGLMHAIIQRIWLLHQAARLPNRESGLSNSDVEELERVLKRWQKRWEHDEEASTMPLNGHGPLSFTSTALLRLAYIRINMNSESLSRSMSSWDPEQIARTFLTIPAMQRSSRATRAALHCAHGLSIPIKLGLAFVARTQVHLWSNQYALCSLEAALFLAKWLEAILLAQKQQLTAQETLVLKFVLDMIAETEHAAEESHLLAQPKRLGAIIARLWATLFRADSVWQIVGLIGQSLTAYADLIDRGDVGG